MSRRPPRRSRPMARCSFPPRSKAVPATNPSPGSLNAAPFLPREPMSPRPAQAPTQSPPPAPRTPVSSLLPLFLSRLQSHPALSPPSLARRAAVRLCGRGAEGFEVPTNDSGPAHSRTSQRCACKFLAGCHAGSCIEFQSVHHRCDAPARSSSAQLAIAPSSSPRTT